LHGATASLGRIVVLTIGEFLSPLKKATQRDLLLAAMYFLRRYEDRESVTTADIKDAFARAKHPKGKKMQHAAVLNQAVPYVHSPGGDDRGHLLWSLTDMGEKRVRELLNLPSAEPEVEHDVGTLTDIAGRISEKKVRGYIEESVTCLQVGALRAATVFLWTGAIATLRDEVWVCGAVAIDQAIKTHNPKAPAFKKKDDFSYVKDSMLLQVAQDLGVIDKTEKGQLEDGLDLRNACGHPTTYSPGPKKVSAFIEDVVGIVWK
jgi:hypothetical protein